MTVSFFVHTACNAYIYSLHFLTAHTEVPSIENVIRCVLSESYLLLHNSFSDNTCKFNHRALPQLQNICNTRTAATALLTIQCFETPNTMYTAGFCLPNCFKTLGAGLPGEAELPDICFLKKNSCI